MVTAVGIRVKKHIFFSSAEKKITMGWRFETSYILGPISLEDIDVKVDNLLGILD
jgi:hypothetical protein